MLRFIVDIPRLIQSALPRKTQRRSAAAEADGAARAEEDSDLHDPLPEVVQIEICDHIDLHTIPPRDVPAVVAEYLHQARQRSYAAVRIIHGKGTGTQRAIVRRILAETDFVHDFTDAPPYAGGWGATIAHLIGEPENVLDLSGNVDE